MAKATRLERRTGGPERVLRLHVYPVLGDLPLRSNRHSHARNFVTTVSRAVVANTARQVHAITRTIFRSAVADKLIPVRENRTAEGAARGSASALPDGRQGTEPRRPERLRALVLLAAGSGLRSGELLGPSVDRADFLRREVRVDRQLVYVSGRPPFLGPPKTPESHRTVPPPTFATEALAVHLTSFVPGDDGLVF